MKIEFSKHLPFKRKDNKGREYGKFSINILPSLYYMNTYSKVVGKRHKRLTLSFLFWSLTIGEYSKTDE